MFLGPLLRDNLCSGTLVLRVHQPLEKSYNGASRIAALGFSTLKFILLSGITWSHPGPSPALWLEAGPTRNSANGRGLNPFGKQISKDRSCLTSGGVKLVVAVAETLFLW